jgi:hypothetical protein
MMMVMAVMAVALHLKLSLRKLPPICQTHILEFCCWLDNFESRIEHVSLSANDGGDCSIGSCDELAGLIHAHG